MSAFTGEKIKKARKAKGISQKEFAARIGVSPQTMNKYEKSYIRVPLNRIEQISEALETPVSYFLEKEKVFTEAKFIPIEGTMDRLMIDPRLYPKKVRALLVKDNEMAPWICEGDVVLYDPVSNAPKSGSLAVVSIDGEKFVRIYYKGSKAMPAMTMAYRQGSLPEKMEGHPKKILELRRKYHENI